MLSVIILKLFKVVSIINILNTIWICKYSGMGVEQKEIEPLMLSAPTLYLSTVIGFVYFFSSWKIYNFFMN